jgi:hypothetical protein
MNKKLELILKVDLQNWTGKEMRLETGNWYENKLLRLKLITGIFFS